MSSDAPAADPRAELERERADLCSQLAELGVVDPHADGVHLDLDSGFADASQVTAERGEAEALAAQLRETLADVETALAKLDAGTYGTCEGCGGEISPARLEAMPAASRCIDCASKR